MDLLQLRYFIAIAEHQHITKAARELRVSQPSLSNTLSRIEGELGLQLFDRQGRNIVLNDNGKVVLEHAKNIFRELSNIQTELDNLNHIENNVISIGSVDSTYVKNWLPFFIYDHPEIIIHHTIASCDQLEAKLSNGEIDFAITDSPTIPEGCDSYLFGKDEYIILGPLDGTIDNSVRQDFSAFANEMFICSPKIEGILRPIDVLSQQTGFEPTIIFEGEQALLSRIFYLGYGHIIACKSNISLPAHWSICEQNSKVYFLSNARASFDIHLIWDSKRILSESAKVFMDYAQHSISQFRPLESERYAKLSTQPFIDMEFL
ncbi:MAG: LysR family transcriptional regulator [Peptococcaceae bacterium]|nr:LysR family transcriptional regulator [Peptococcaceae bacterium]